MMISTDLLEPLELLHPAPLAETATALRGGSLELEAYLGPLCDRIEAVNPLVQALLPEQDRRGRLMREAAILQARCPEPGGRPPLYGIPLGAKDIFHVDGFPTAAGSQLPPSLFTGPEAQSVALLRAAGALIVGKTVTTEFAYFEPGPTRNPHNLEHTPGGSSSGSAAAVTAGLCPLAVGTQTVGSVIRPAAFCGIVGFKPTLGRIPTRGVIPFSQSADHVGLFTQDVEGIRLAASLLCTDWRTPPEYAELAPLPVLGIPVGPYLAQASPEGLSAFERQALKLEGAGYTIRRVETLGDFEAIRQRHERMIAAEAAAVHRSWFAQYEALYRPRTAELIHEGQQVTPDELAAARAGRAVLRAQLEAAMEEAGIDLWISPAAPGPAPEGIDTTGDPVMNLVWTHAGLPAVTLPAGLAANGLPLGLQCTARFMADEQLLTWAGPLSNALADLC
jgi:Asp-tRNA(Asn)/Glu-tRNA(Gln) amidotransferase A subunit family amidase